MSNNRWNRILLRVVTNTWFILFLIILGPIITCAIVNLPVAKNTGQDSDWIGYFGNYSGGIIGGFVAFLIAWIQIKAQRKSEMERDIEHNRSYIIAEWFRAPISLRGLVTSENSRIIVNSYYEDIYNYLTQEDKDNISIIFYKIQHVGSPEVILDCSISIEIMEHKTGEIYSINSHIGVIEKNIEVFIPVCKKDINEIIPQNFSIEYTSIRGERILFIHDVHENKEAYFVVGKDGLRRRIFEFELVNSSWIYPNKVQNFDEKHN